MVREFTLILKYTEILLTIFTLLHKKTINHSIIITFFNKIWGLHSYLTKLKKWNVELLFLLKHASESIKVKSKIVETPSLWLVIYLGYLPLLFAAAICRGYLSWEFAVRICCGYLPWVFCICKQILFGICKQILFTWKQTFFRCEQIFFVCEMFFVNGVPFCYCRGSYGQP